MVHYLPTVNALLNTCAAALLMLGWRAIKMGERRTHQRYMILALCCSALFLFSYLLYHWLVPGVTRYQGTGLRRILYFIILLTHTPLATIMVPFIVAAVVYALKKDYARHIRLTRWLMPVWLYVSVTGVLIFLMLYVLPQ